MKYLKTFAVMAILFICVQAAQTQEVTYKNHKTKYFNIAKQAVPKFVKIIQVLETINDRQTLLYHKNTLITKFKSLFQVLHKPLALLKALPTTQQKLDFLVWFSTLNDDYKNHAMKLFKNLKRIRSIQKCSKIVLVIKRKSGYYSF